MEKKRKLLLSKARIIVVKIGSALLTDKNGGLSSDKAQKIVNDLLPALKKGYKIVLVSSGSVACGSGVLFENRLPMSVPEKQAAASVGQIELMTKYHSLFGEHGIVIGQVLLSETELKNKESFLNARNTLHELLNNGVMPIVNENDTVSTSELKFGDNDFLGAALCSLLEADLYIILTDTDGVYENFHDKQKRRLIPYVTKVDSELYAQVSSKTKRFSKGGMRSKIKAMELTMKSGAMGLIAGGNEEGIFRKILKNENVGTAFLPAKDVYPQRKKWILNNVYLKTKGNIIVDNGAYEALLNKGSSLLPGGVVQCDGEFKRGDTVNICREEDGLVFAKGFSNYSFKELELIKGKNSSEIKKLLGVNDYAEAVHRDNMLLTSP